MENKKHQATKTETIDELTQLLSKLNWFENKLEKLLEKEAKTTKGELEILMENSEGIMVTDHGQDKQKIDNNSRINRKYLSKIVRECKEGVVLVDKTGSIIDANTRIELLLGYEKEDFKNWNMKTVFPLVGRLGGVSRYSGAFSQYLYLLQKSKNLPIETTLLDKSKNKLVFLTKTVSLKDNSGQLLGAIILLKNISERNHVEVQIKQKKEHLVKLLETSRKIEITERLTEDIEEKRNYIEGILESSKDGITVTDISGVLKKANTAISRLLGYTPHELEGRHWAELFPYEEKEFTTTYGNKISSGGSYAKDVLEKIDALFSKGKAYFECYMLRKDEILIPVGCSVYWIHDRKSQRIDGITIVRDLSEMKKAELKLQQAYHESQEAKDYLENIISTAVDGIVTVDPQGMITKVNEAVEKLTGYSSEEIQGMHISQLGGYNYKAQHRSIRNVIDKIFKDERVSEFEVTWERKDGTLISTELNSALLKDKEGNILGGVIGVRDIGERKKIHEIEMKNAFISNISHEFRTPLTLSIGPLEGLLREEYGKIRKETKDQVGLALRNNRRLLKLVNQLLEVTRLKSENNNLNHYKRDCNEFLSNVVDAFTFLVKKKNITLNFTPWEDSEPFYIDPGKIERVMFNIIGNAFKFTPKGGTITVDAKRDRETEDNGFLKISVKDTGIGIEKEDLPHIFEKFHQAESGSSRRHEGTGIGLSLAKEFTELHGGKIEVESEYGKGSTFTIYIPLGRNHIKDQSRVQLKEEADEILVTQKEIELSNLGYDQMKMKGKKPTGEKPLILFIDDNPDVRRYMTDILSKQYEIITAEDGLKGLEQLNHYTPDLIVSDIMMPRMDGYAFCKKIKSNPGLRQIPLIFLTARADTELKIESLEEGADDYIVKPFNSKELLARVKSLLRIQALMRENSAKEKKIAELTKVMHEKFRYHNIIGKSKPMLEIYRFLENINGTESSILISGDTGTGKELVAHAVHYNSKRKNSPFIIVDCSVLNKNLLESELFGHVKGSFTGAIADKKGFFELADGGTLFLDEIGEMSLDTQVKLLRALEEGTFRPVGSSEEKKVSVRIIAATNKNLKILISNKKFREDLYYRINVINIALPVLKERREDIPLLVEHFMNELNGSNGIKRSLNKEALNQLTEYTYPGNVRELKNIIERAFMLCEGDTIGLRDLPLEVRGDTRETALPSDYSERVTLGDIRKHTEREVLSRTLKQVKGNKLRAAKLLKISRSTLYAKIEEHHIEC